VSALKNTTAAAECLTNILLTAPDGLSVIFHGAAYPSNTSGNAEQSVSFSILCSSSTEEPKFLSYDGKQVKIEWSAPSGCQSSSEPPPAEDDTTGGGSKRSPGSGVGFFFLVYVVYIV
jgi:hypothetical protein